jgi:anti-sigma-K factor RskA
MNWENRIERLAARARAEDLPRVDVAHSVLVMLTSGQAEPLTVAERFWMWLAAASAAVAVPAAAIALFVYHTSTGPLPEIVDSISWAM